MPETKLAPVLEGHLIKKLLDEKKANILYDLLKIQSLKDEYGFPLNILDDLEQLITCLVGQIVVRDEAIKKLAEVSGQLVTTINYDYNIDDLFPTKKEEKEQR